MRGVGFLPFRPETRDPTLLTTILSGGDSIPAVFRYSLTLDQDSLLFIHHRTLLLPGNPLDISPMPTRGDNRLLVAVDPGESTGDGGGGGSNSLLLLADDEAVSFPFDESTDGAVLHVTPAEARGLLYTTAHLRKQGPEAREKPGEQENRRKAGGQMEE